MADKYMLLHEVTFRYAIAIRIQGAPLFHEGVCL